MIWKLSNISPCSISHNCELLHRNPILDKLSWLDSVACGSSFIQQLSLHNKKFETFALASEGKIPRYVGYRNVHCQASLKELAGIVTMLSIMSL